MSATSDTQTTGAMADADGQAAPEAREGGAPEETEEREDLPLNQVFSLLKNRRRRDVLKYLREVEEDAVSIGELAEHIAAIENDTTVDAISSSQRKRVYVGLYQCHLPKMDDMDVIDFNRSRGRITIGDNASQLERFLDADGGSAYWNHRVYAGISVGGLVALSLTWLAAAPAVLTAELALAGVVVATLAYALYNLYRESDLDVDAPIPR